MVIVTVVEIRESSLGVLKLLVAGNFSYVKFVVTNVRDFIKKGESCGETLSFTRDLQTHISSK